MRCASSYTKSAHKLSALARKHNHCMVQQAASDIQGRHFTHRILKSTKALSYEILQLFRIKMNVWDFLMGKTSESMRIWSNQFSQSDVMSRRSRYVKFDVQQFCGESSDFTRLICSTETFLTHFAKPSITCILHRSCSIIVLKQKCNTEYSHIFETEI